jgi:putative endonuclease
MAFWCYMLHCADRSFYVGHPDNLETRMGQHHRGQAAAYTRTRLPIKLVWSQAFGSRIEALEAERRIKGWSRAKKLALIREDWALISELARSRSNVLRQAQDERGESNCDG